MNNNQELFSISERTESGCKWQKKQFSEIRSLRVTTCKSFFIPEVMTLFLKSLQEKLGKMVGFWIFLRASTIGFIFNRPKWHSEYFAIANKKQESFYKHCFKKSMFLFIIFNILKKKHGAKEADKIIADSLMPCTLAYMKMTYKPVKDWPQLEAWWEQSVDYIGDMPEDNQGLDGTVYIAEDKSELKWHTVKCAHAEVLMAYGLKRTTACMCMADHITYHTLFPGIVFKRNNCIGVGHPFCDHHARVKKPEDIGNEEIQYGDCLKFEGGREYVRYWEEYAKSYFFKDKKEWKRYADRIYDKIRK